MWGESQEYDPFAGLCEKRPVRVLAGLRYELRKGADVAPAWSQFLYNAGRQTDYAGGRGPRCPAFGHTSTANA